MNTGGPAFPHGFVDHGRTQTLPGLGMTLLDWFAGQTLKKIANQYPMDIRENEYLDPIEKIVAGKCYRYALAMIAERERIMKEQP